MATVFSLNVPVPGQVEGLADELHPQLASFDRVREQHTLVCKRLGDPAPGEYAVVRERARRALSGTAPFAARVAGVDYFVDPPEGPGPVVFLAVESPGLVAAHGRLCEAFEPAAGIEDEEYVPHVTLARGGTVDDARALAERAVDPVEWTATALVFHDHEHGGETGRIALPA
jgi:2'-5' RNA ligase